MLRSSPTVDRVSISAPGMIGDLGGAGRSPILKCLLSKCCRSLRVGPYLRVLKALCRLKSGRCALQGLMGRRMIDALPRKAGAIPGKPNGYESMAEGLDRRHGACARFRIPRFARFVGSGR